MSTKDDDERQITPFAAILQQIAKGSAHNRLSAAMAELAAAVQEHGKAGTLTITVKVEPTKGSETLTIGVTHTSKVPQATEASIFYADEETGALSRNDPRQTQLPLYDANSIGETA